MTSTLHRPSARRRPLRRIECQSKPRLPKTKRELQALVPLAPVEDENAYDRARELCDRLAGYDDLSAAQEHWFNELTSFMEAYEKEHYPL